MRVVTASGWERINRAVVSGRIIPYLVFVMFTVAAAGTAAVEILSPNSFDSLGDAAWWAATTVTTIGYGDVVPGTSGGRVVAVFVMFASVATVSFTTAVVTAAFVGYQQRKLSGEAERHAELVATLARMEERLERVEQRLSQR